MAMSTESLVSTIPLATGGVIPLPSSAGAGPRAAFNVMTFRPAVEIPRREYRPP